VVLKDGSTIQVKARMPRQTLTTSLGVIRSWDFDYLVAVLFSTDGAVIKAVELDVESARGIATPNKLQNGWVITTTSEFLEHPSARTITDGLNSILGDQPIKMPKSTGTRNEFPNKGRSDAQTNSLMQSPSKLPGEARNSMLDHDFKQWMLSEGFSEGTVNTRIANCRKVERYEGSLDEHYDSDRCRSLLERMKYLPNQQQKHSIPIDGDVKNGMSALCSAVRLYVSFRNNETGVRGERRAGWY